MLIINVKNWPCSFNELGNGDTPVEGCFAGAVTSDNAFKRRMSDALRRAAISAKVPGLEDAIDVLVSFDNGHVPSLVHDPSIKDNELPLVCQTLLIEAQGFFQNLGLSFDDRDRLGCALLRAAKSFQRPGSITKVYVKFDRE